MVQTPLQLTLLMGRHPSDQGLPIQADDRIAIDGDAVIGLNGEPLITGVSSHQQRQLQGRLHHPYFWSGIQLMGAPW